MVFIWIFNFKLNWQRDLQQMLGSEKFYRVVVMGW